MRRTVFSVVCVCVCVCMCVCVCVTEEVVAVLPTSSSFGTWWGSVWLRRALVFPKGVFLVSVPAALPPHHHALHPATPATP
jgi:hypothetical protein